MAKDFEDAIELALALFIRFEGTRLRPYVCPSGVSTIGIGATSYLHGRAVQLTHLPITREAAIALCHASIRCRYAPMTYALCPGVGSSRRLAALIDFAFNLGIGALKSRMLRKRVNAGRWADVPCGLRKWIYSRSKPLRGLVLRREAEVALI